jgi:GNAT acetyltransferase-like protein
MTMTAQLEPLAECPEWSSRALAAFHGATVFHEPWYLGLLGVEDLWTVRSAGALIAGLPAFHAGDRRALAQSSLSIPYGGLAFAPCALGPRRRMLRHRAIMQAAIEALGRAYEQIDISLSPAIRDVVPFLQAGFVPEVRYTYVCPPGASEPMSSGRRNDLARARKARLAVRDDLGLDHFDVGASVRWADDPAYATTAGAVLRAAIARGRGHAWLAVSAERPVAGLFACWDAHHGYTTHAYTTDEGAELGAATLLYGHAITHLHALGLAVDLEGSVLPGVEQFYQSLGAEQTLYLRLHWHRDRNRRPGAELYDYT